MGFTPGWFSALCPASWNEVFLQPIVQVVGSKLCTLPPERIRSEWKRELRVLRYQSGFSTSHQNHKNQFSNKPTNCIDKSTRGAHLLHHANTRHIHSAMHKQANPLPAFIRPLHLPLLHLCQLSTLWEAQQQQSITAHTKRNAAPIVWDCGASQWTEAAGLIGINLILQNGSPQATASTLSPLFMPNYLSVSPALTGRVVLMAKPQRWLGQTGVVAKH